MYRYPVFRWLPALVMMGIIFWFSSQPSRELPDFDWADRLVKKSGHVLGYAMLAAGYWYALEGQGNYFRLAWLMSILYAGTDEFHQSFIPERHPSLWDVLIFDNLGALLGLWLAVRFVKKNDQPSHQLIAKAKS